MAATQAIYGSTELLQIADSVAREKGLSKESVIEAMEQAIQTAGRRKYGHEHDIRAEIDKKTGEIKLFRVRTVVEDGLKESENPEEEGGFDSMKQLHLKDAHKIDKNLQIGDQLRDLLP